VLLGTSELRRGRVDRTRRHNRVVPGQRAAATAIGGNASSLCASARRRGIVMAQPSAGARWTLLDGFDVPLPVPCGSILARLRSARSIADRAKRASSDADGDLPRCRRSGWYVLALVHSCSPALRYHTGLPHPVSDGRAPPDAVRVAYLAATGLPLLLSSHRTVIIFGAIVLAGLVVAYAFYWEALVSVWCFFAAVASVVILCHFEWSRRHGLRGAGA
jgi:hypothetical protein